MLISHLFPCQLNKLSDLLTCTESTNWFPESKASVRGTLFRARIVLKKLSIVPSPLEQKSALEAILALQMLQLQKRAICSGNRALFLMRLPPNFSK